jgi:hypothetical protein
MSRPFVDVLRDVRYGAAVEELTAHLTELVETVRKTGRAGSITLKLTVKPAAKGDVSALTVDDAVSVKKPTMEHGTTVFFATAENGLSRRDPRQPDLIDLRPSTPVVRELKDATRS